jgi:hypothetical protein
VRDFILITTGYYTTSGGPQAIEAIHKIPPVYFLSHGYPNPFLSHISIRYGIPCKTQLSVKVYDASGRLVRDLVEGHVQPGYHRITWKGDDSRGRHLPSGTYFIRMESEDFKSTRKVVLMR